MIGTIVSYSLRHRLLVFILVFVVVGLGAYSLLKLPIDAFPM